MFAWPPNPVTKPVILARFAVFPAGNSQFQPLPHRAGCPELVGTEEAECWQNPYSVRIHRLTWEAPRSRLNGSTQTLYTHHRHPIRGLETETRPLLSVHLSPCHLSLTLGNLPSLPSVVLRLHLPTHWISNRPSLFNRPLSTFAGLIYTLVVPHTR